MQGVEGLASPMQPSNCLHESPSYPFAHIRVQRLAALSDATVPPMHLPAGAQRLLRTVQLARACKIQLPLQLRAFAAASGQLDAIRSLRESTSAPISDVKKALVEADWNIEEAYKVLRKKGVAAASKKATRHAAEGLIGIASDGHAAAIVEVNSETDFATKTEQFRSMVQSVATAALSSEGSGRIESNALASCSTDQGSKVVDAIAECAGTVRENVQLRRAHRLMCPSGVIASYLHASSGPGLGKMGALVALADSQGALQEEAASKIKELGGSIAMHIVATRPLSLDRKSVPAEALEAERKLLTEQAEKSGKPANIIDRMVAGRLHKFYEDNCLLEQRYVKDDAKKIQEVLKDVSKAIGADLQIQDFVRFQCGEGLENEQSSFADDVAQALQQTG